MKGMDPTTLNPNADSRELIELTKQLVGIRSENPPGEQNEIGDFIESRMREIGLEVERYDLEPGKPNVIGKLEGKIARPVLMLNGHVDTVPVGDAARWRSDPFKPVVRDAKLYGRGAADMKGGLAAMIHAAKNIVKMDSELKGTLLIACVVDEEVTGYGTKSLVERGYNADFAVVGEPTECAVLTAHKGVLEFNVSTTGISAHASTPRNGLNAIYKMSKVILAFQKYLDELEKNSHPLVGSPSVNVGKIWGGVASSVVPERCEIAVERRILPGEDPDGVKHGIQEVLETVKNDDPELKLDWRVTLEVDASETPFDSLIARISLEAVSEVTGIAQRPKGFAAACDMRFLVNRGKIPTVILGPGSLDQAHVSDEYVETKQLIDAARIYRLIARKLLQ
jgi:succinyl-diaminopimelate desuccinylase